MCTPRRSIRKGAYALLGLALFAVSVPAFAQDDPPDRVARLSYLRGDVSFQPAGDEDWVEANLNRPLATGDKLYTDHDSRVEMEVGAATLRLDAQSSFDILNLDDNVAQTELTQGVMNLHVRRVAQGQSYEVDTPTLAFVVTQPGDYRIDIAPDGSSSMVTVFSGNGAVYGENNASYTMKAGESVRFHDAGLQDYEVLDVPRGDEFDGWVQTRNDRYEHSQSRQYVSDEVIGYADLDDYGGWSDSPDYGHVWYPSNVEAGWAPYRTGNWAWVDPWGWTWVDNAAWGFAPFHYGRWVNSGDRWGWCPGRYDARPIYAPALVAFVGGNGWGIGVNTGGPVGWFPLGPRDVYMPWYHTSHDYFTNVNVRNTTVINNTYVNNVYNNYSTGRPMNNVNYAYQRNAAAVTAVSRETFVGARPVNAARVQVNANQLRTSNVVSRVGIAPERASFVGAGGRARAVPNAPALDRRVIARTAPPPRTAPVQTRIAAIQKNNSQPLPRSELRRIAPAAGAVAAAGAAAVVANRNQPQHVQVVGQGAKPQPLPARAQGAAAQANAAQRGQPQTRNPATPPTATTPNARVQPQTREAATPQRGQPPERTTVQHGQTPANTAPQTREQPANGNGLPSSRFAPHQGQAARTTGDAPARATGNANANAARERTAPTNAQTQRTQPNEHAPANTRTPVERTQTTPDTVRHAPPPARNTPTENTPAHTRTTPTENTPAHTRTTPTETQRRTVEPQERTTPQQHSAPVQQRTPPPQSTQREYTPRTAPQPPRAEPQQRTAPPPQQQRSAPPVQQQRTAPPAQQRTAPQQEHQPPPDRRTPAQKKKDEEDNGGHR